MVKTAIIGASGFVGRHLFQAYRRIHADTIGTTFSKNEKQLRPFDIRKSKLAALGLLEGGCQALLIASAIPDLAYCEQYKEDAYAVNVTGTLELVRQAVELDIQPIFLSSNYVFDGNTGGYDDDAATNPSTEYGRQKQIVEQELPAITDKYLIVRLSKMYGLQRGDGTLLDECASALNSGRQILAADDQIFCPTYADDLAKAIIAIQERGLTGIINVCSPERWSRYQIAVGMAQAMRLDGALIKRIALNDIPSLAGRPMNTSMATTRLVREVGFHFSSLEGSMLRVAAHWTKT